MLSDEMRQDTIQYFLPQFRFYPYIIVPKSVVQMISIGNYLLFGFSSQHNWILEIIKYLKIVFFIEGVE